jgi:predicted TIM-barrel fold metal-dependent hydrolase
MMQLPLSPAPIDCDLHPTLPGLKLLLPFLDGHWRESIVERAIHELDSISYPDNSPLTARADWRPEKGKPGASLADMQRHILDPLGTRIGILNCLYGVQLLFSEDMAAAFARALNDWIAKEWLDRDPRLRASIVVPPQSAELAVEEIERRAGDKRFVQVMLLVMGETTLGRRHQWPIYAAAERHGLPVAVHAGSGYRHAVTPVGWPSYYAEDYASQAIAFQSQLASLLSEGVFQKHPKLKFVFLESGFTWLPPFMWRFTKYWKGARIEVPWIDRPPFEIVREHVRFSLQPFDAPPEPAMVERLMEHMGSDEMLLFSSDYPHWQFDGLDVLPAGMPSRMLSKVLAENALATYPRLAG